jgi:divalent metal cation (Fe/Co/Zn/Cd) transporter
MNVFADVMEMVNASQSQADVVRDIPTTLALAAAVVSLLVKEGMYRWTMEIANRNQSSLLVSNAWHHRAGLSNPGFLFCLLNSLCLLVSRDVSTPFLCTCVDALTSLISLPAIAGAMYGIPILDPLGGVVVSLIVARMGVNLTVESLCHLLDRLTAKDLVLVDRLTAASSDVAGTHQRGFCVPVCD